MKSSLCRCATSARNSDIVSVLTPGQHEAVHRAVVRADRAESIEVLALQPWADHGPRVMRRPAESGRAQQPEAGFVLEHQPHPATTFSLAPDLLAYRAPEFQSIERDLVSSLRSPSGLDTAQDLRHVALNMRIEALEARAGEAGVGQGGAVRNEDAGV